MFGRYVSAKRFDGNSDGSGFFIASGVKLDRLTSESIGKIAIKKIVKIYKHILDLSIIILYCTPFSISKDNCSINQRYISALLLHTIFTSSHLIR